MIESINNLIRSDRPESPTDLIFIFGNLILLALLIYATLAKATIPHLEAMLLALGGYKTVKVWSGKQSENQQPKPAEPKLTEADKQLETKAPTN